MVVFGCHLKNEEVHMDCSSGDCDKCSGWDSLSSNISNTKLSSWEGNENVWDWQLHGGSVLALILVCCDNVTMPAKLFMPATWSDGQNS